MDLIQKAKSLRCVIKNNEYYLWEIQRWLRETHNIHIYVEPVWSEDDTIKIPEYVGWYITVGFDEADPPVYYTTYEEALEQALFEALTWLKEKLNGKVI
jgi:hypothetical protein